MMRILMILAAICMLAANPALAESDCASGLSGDLRALLRGGATVWTLGAENEKADTDVYKLLARAAPFGAKEAKLSLTSAAMVAVNCAALEGSDEYAADLRIQLADITGIKVRNLTADRVQKWLRQRLENGTPGQFHLLNEPEQVVFSNLLCHYLLDLEGNQSAVETLLADAQLPFCFGTNE